MSACYLFPGQGSQAVGMGKALAEAFPEAKEVWNAADEALGFSLSSLCWNGPEEQLTQTENTQPALLTTSIAAHAALTMRTDIRASCATGHSLGEWSAWVSAGALSFADAVRLVRLRGQAMQRAVPAGEGKMAAVLGMDAAAVAAWCKEIADACDAVCEPANFNGGGQVVISGQAAAIDHAIATGKDKGAKRVIPLKVSAPFHCSLMAPAAEEMRAALADVAINKPMFPVIANVTGAPVDDPALVKKLLIEQITGSVQWEACIGMATTLATRGLEIGHGKTLAGLARRIARHWDVTTVSDPDEVAGLMDKEK